MKIYLHEPQQKHSKLLLLCIIRRIYYILEAPGCSFVWETRN